MHIEILVNKEETRFKYIVTLFKTQISTCFQVCINSASLNAPRINKSSVLVESDTIENAREDVVGELKRLFEKYGYSFNYSFYDMKADELNELLSVCNSITIDLE